MIILIILVLTTRQTLIYEFQASQNIKDEWEGDFYTCGNVQYFQFNYNSRIFLDLEPHSQIIMDAQFIKCNENYQEEKIFMDYQEQIHLNQVTIDLPCIFFDISIIHNHNRRTVWIEIYLTNLGLISLKLSTVKCQYESAGCITNHHKICLQWKLHQYSFNQKQITYSEGWTVELNYYTRNWCGNCQFLVFSEIQYCTQLPSHQDVLIRLFKDISNSIIVDYIYGKKTFDSNSAQIEILIKNHHDPIFVLKITTQINGQQSRIRDFETFYTYSDVILNILNEGCLQQIDDKCLTCLEGWIQDEFLEKCLPICGDGKIQGQEECDDTNLISDDGCFQCKLSCPNFCNQCKFGKCLQCQSNYQLINSSCEEINNNNGFEPLNQIYNSFSILLFYANYYHLSLQDYFVNQKPSQIFDYNFQTFESLEQYQQQQQQ